MTITINLSYNSQPVQVDICLQDKEVITSMKWTALYQQAQKGSLPYYWLSIAMIEGVVENQKSYIGQCYDGASFQKCRAVQNITYQEEFKDPLTRSTILTTYHVFFNCFEFSGESQNKLPLKALVFPTLSNFDFSDLPAKNPDLKAIAMASLNGATAENNQLREKLGQSQYIIGSHLLKSSQGEMKLEGLRWIWASAKQGIKEADQILEKKIVLTNGI